MFNGINQQSTTLIDRGASVYCFACVRNKYLARSWFLSRLCVQVARFHTDISNEISFYCDRNQTKMGKLEQAKSCSNNYVCRHPYPPFNIHYRYRFHAPHHDTYEVSWVSFTTEKLENYNWNYLDHYICTRGHTDFALVEVSGFICVPPVKRNRLLPFLLRLSSIGDFECFYCHCIILRLAKSWKALQGATYTLYLVMSSKRHWWMASCVSSKDGSTKYDGQTPTKTG